jgi:ASC-1-like (ASCH) protein
MVEYKKNLSEPWFTLILLGIKTCEGRLDKGDFSLMKKDDTIVFENNELGFNRSFSCSIKKINYYTTFSDYLETEKLKKCLPGITNIEDGLKVYYKYYSKADENKYHIIAIHLKIKK